MCIVGPVLVFVRARVSYNNDGLSEQREAPMRRIDQHFYDFSFSITWPAAFHRDLRHSRSMGVCSSA